MTDQAKPDEGELKPCPFCGGTAKQFPPYFIECQCGFRFDDVFAPDFSWDSTVKFWNARTTQCSEVGVTDAMVNAAIQEMDFTWPESREHMRRAIAAALAGRKLP